MDTVIGSDGNRLPDMLQKRDAAIRVGIACRVIRMCSEIEVATVVFINALREACRSGEHQAITKRNVCGDFATVFRNLLTVGGVADCLCGAIKQRAVGETKDWREVKFILANTIVLCNRMGCTKFHTMLLTVENRDGGDVFRSEFRNRQRQAGCGVN